MDRRDTQRHRLAAALSVTHGTLGRGANPHRLFAYAGPALAFVFFHSMRPAAAPLAQEQHP